MPGVYRSPGVYVEEIATLPPSVAEVSTAVPAFLGYTETGDALSPTRIQSLREYEQTFGGPPPVVTNVNVTKDAAGAATYNTDLLKDGSIPFLYYSLRLYFDNGGGPCYIVSLGSYKDNPALDAFKKGLDALRTEDEPTLIVMPDATRLADDFSAACGAALDHCGLLRDRFAVLDLKQNQTAADFRKVSSNSLAYGAAYAPFLDTSLAYAYNEDTVTITVPPGPTTFTGTVGGLSVNCVAAPDKTPSVAVAGGAGVVFATDATPKLTVTAATGATTKDVSDAWVTWKAANPGSVNGFDILAGDTTAVAVKTGSLTAPATPALPKLSSFKNTDTGVYNQVKTTLNTLRATLPPSGAVAGIYASVDRDRGVWKAPANVAVSSVLGLDRTFTNDDLDGLNIDPTSGKSINAIRSFTGRGTLVWGARTLAGNDNEWRYVPVRRLFIMIEESSLKATAFAVFEPNTAETWLKVEAMIESFLYGLWERGALAGTKPEDAYFVNVGLGTTMTAQDILEGRMIVKVGVAAVRPAEFIILQFSHKLQVS